MKKTVRFYAEELPADWPPHVARFMRMLTNFSMLGLQDLMAPRGYHRVVLEARINRGDPLKKVLREATKVLNEKDLWRFVRWLTRKRKGKKTADIDCLICLLDGENALTGNPSKDSAEISRRVGVKGFLTAEAYRKRVARLRLLGVKLKKPDKMRTPVLSVAQKTLAMFNGTNGSGTIRVERARRRRSPGRADTNNSPDLHPIARAGSALPLDGIQQNRTR
jgi:hypothetical protein